jgi:cyclophilin family peptidyl-prolyl cis-trans isomerase
MSILSPFKDNAGVFLPILGLLAVVIAISFIDIQNPGSFVFDREDPDKWVYLQEPEMLLEEGVDYKAYLSTDYGNFKINLFETVAPRNVNNFVFLAREGFYDDLAFHRIIPSFIIQAGYRGNSVQYYIEDEMTDAVKFKEYTVAMANEDKPNTNSSQFFIALKDSDVSHLEGEYTIIGEVEEGFDIVEKIGDSRVDRNYLPKKEISIRRIIIKEEIF